MLAFDPEPVGTGDHTDITVFDEGDTAAGVAILDVSDNTMVVQFDRELTVPASIIIGPANATTFAADAHLTKPAAADVVGFVASTAIRTDATHLQITFVDIDTLDPIVITEIPDATHWYVAGEPATAVTIGPAGAYVEITTAAPTPSHSTAECDDGATVSNGALNWIPLWTAAY